jgi:DNA-binding HxlR family transcriptional regulator
MIKKIKGVKAKDEVIKSSKNKVTAKNNINKDLQIRCPMHRLVNLLTGPWTTYILWLLRSHGPQRFGQLKKQLPQISAKVLTDRLRMLEEEKIINRHQKETIPPQVTYSLTKHGKQLDKLLDEINKLAQKWYNS